MLPTNARFSASCLAITLVAAFAPALAACSGAPEASSESATIEVPPSSLEGQSASWCRHPIPGTCDFYISCLETDHPCGTDGYAQSYGDKYCRKFNSETGRFTSQGVAWRDATLSCLQYRLVPYLGSTPVTCDRITEVAFDSHPECYTQIGYSICDLPKSDWWTIVDTVDGSDYLSVNAARQIVQTGKTCIGGWTSALSAGDDPALEARSDPESVIARTLARPHTTQERDLIEKIQLVNELAERLAQSSGSSRR